jgi:hypothetical protein
VSMRRGRDRSPAPEQLLQCALKRLCMSLADASSIDRPPTDRIRGAVAE